MHHSLLFACRALGVAAALFCLPLRSVGQGTGGATVRGKVTTGENEPLPGVSVVVKGTTNGASTDAGGNYSLSVPAGAATLVFSYIGYTSEEVSIGNRTTIDLSLVPDIESLSEVVVVGYGTVKKSDLTGSVASVKSEELKQTPIANFVQGLQARVSGVQVTQNSGAPGGSNSVRIRGNNSISGSSEPLYVVDGFPVGSSGGATGGVGFGNSTGNALNPLSTISPNDIESIEVLKDASATAIYGTRGANGVVLITTKRGKAGVTNVTYDGYYGVQQINRKLDLMNATEFARFENEVSGSNLFPDPEGLGEGTDWQDEIFREAPIQNHQISVSSGSEKTQFSLSTDYFRQDGIIIGSDYTRGSLRLNLDHQVGRNLKVGTSLTYSYSVNNGTVSATDAENAGSGIVTSALTAPPTIQPYDSLGNPTLFGNAGGARYLDWNNPVAFESQVLNRNTTGRLLGNLFAEYRILEGFTYRFVVGADLLSDVRDSYVGRLIRFGQANGGLGGRAHANTNNVLHESILTYDRKFNNDHALTLTGVFSTQSQIRATDNISALLFPNDVLTNDNLGLATTVTAGTSREKWRLDSYTARANYNFRSKYLLTLAARVDGSSRFGANNKYGFFPSVAVAWRIVEEGFMQSLPVVSDLKLRASYGVTGNADIPLYGSLARLTPNGNYGFGNVRNVGIGPDNIANPDLKWENSYQTDIGVDIGLLTNRLTFTADYYVKTTKDLLLSRSVPLSSGFATAIGNFGELENRGFEVALTAAVLNGNFKWNVSGNVSANRNRITKIDGTRNEILTTSGNIGSFTNASILRVGEPIGSFYGYFFDGIYQTGDNVPTGKFPGDVRYRDLNGDGNVSAADQNIIGNPNPDYIFGLTNNFRWGNFDLSVFVQGVQGNDLFFTQRLVLEVGGGLRNQLQEYVNRWTPANPSNRYVRAYQNQRLNQADIFIEDGSFVRFKNVTLGYNLPVDKLNLKWLKGARLYASGNNLLTFTDYTGYDPEVNTAGQNSLQLGVDNSGYPVARSYLVGVQVTF
ncbi:MAG: TonB-dependent receptor [Ferruginibacter sp.]|nr:TonB-dependent receptor [Cytophagales bacterium]